MGFSLQNGRSEVAREVASIADLIEADIQYCRLEINYALLTVFVLIHLVKKPQQATSGVTRVRLPNYHYMTR